MRTFVPGVCLALLCLALAGPAGVVAQDTKDKKDAKEGKKFEIPYKFTKASHIVVRAKINGKGPYNFVLDTGAPALFVATKVAEKSKVKPDRDGWGDLDKFEIEGGLVISKARARIETPFQLEGMNGLGMAGMEIHGMLGYNILAKYRMTFDFTKSKLEFTELNYKPDEPFKLRGKGNQGIGGLEFMGQAMKLLGGLLGKKATPEVALRGFLGMSLVNGEESPKVESVLAKGPAGAAGLQKGDVVLKVNDRTVVDVSDVVRLAGKAVAKDEVTMTVRRGKETKKITIKAGEGI